MKDERAAGLWLVPMYAALSAELQAQAFQPAPEGLRKVQPAPCPIMTAPGCQGLARLCCPAAHTARRAIRHEWTLPARDFIQYHIMKPCAAGDRKHDLAGVR